MEDESKIFGIKNIVKICSIFVSITFIAIILANYLINDEFRNKIDSKIFKKKIDENLSNIIELNSDNNPYVCAYNKYIAIFSKNILNIYNQNALLMNTIDMNIIKPCSASNGQFLVLAENEGNKLYLISDTVVKWSKELDGQIYRVSINKNGYVVVLLKNATYNSMVEVFNPDGNQVVKSYSRKNSVICSEISNNNEYLAIGQIYYSGTIIKSTVKLISIKEVMNNSKNSIVNTYESESSKILNNIKFNDKNEAICMFDTYIQKLTAQTDERLYTLTDDDIFVDINLGNNIIIVKKETSGLFSYKYQMDIKNTIRKTNKIYILDNELPKRIDIFSKFVCIKLINELKIVGDNGWLIRSYKYKNEIQNIVIGENIIGIVYNNKVEIAEF